MAKKAVAVELAESLVKFWINVYMVWQDGLSPIPYRSRWGVIFLYKLDYLVAHSYWRC